MIQTLEQKRAQPPDPEHFAESSARENLIEHVFLGELLRGLWRKNVRDLEVLRPEVDNGGYDLALEFRGLIRHMQLKSSYRRAQRSEVTAHVKLMDRPSASASCHGQTTPCGLKLRTRRSVDCLEGSRTMIA